MTGTDHQNLSGFETPEREIPAPPVPIDDATREQLVRQLCAVVLGHTPEAIVDFISDGFPAEVDAELERTGSREEFSAHVDMLLVTLQAPVDGG